MCITSWTLINKLLTQSVMHHGPRSRLQSRWAKLMYHSWEWALRNGHHTWIRSVVKCAYVSGNVFEKQNEQTTAVVVGWKPEIGIAGLHCTYTGRLQQFNDPYIGAVDVVVAETNCFLCYWNKYHAVAEFVALDENLDSLSLLEAFIPRFEGLSGLRAAVTVAAVVDVAADTNIV